VDDHTVQPTLVLLAGLPGTGKTTLAYVLVLHTEQPLEKLVATA
jgi:replication-associated recombination protein RarA